MLVLGHIGTAGACYVAMMRMRTARQGTIVTCSQIGVCLCSFNFGGLGRDHGVGARRLQSHVGFRLPCDRLSGDIDASR